MAIPVRFPRYVVTSVLLRTAELIQSVPHTLQAGTEIVSNDENHGFSGGLAEGVLALDSSRCIIETIKV